MSNKLNKFIKDALTEATKSFLRAARLRVPIWSGESKAGFAEAASRVGLSWAASTGPGTKSGKGPKTGLEQGSFSFKSADLNFQIIIANDVFQFTLYDTVPPPSGARYPPRGGSKSFPWEAMQAGINAFNNTLRKEYMNTLFTKVIPSGFEVQIYRELVR